jgi:hypothetical protein
VLFEQEVDQAPIVPVAVEANLRDGTRTTPHALHLVRISSDRVQGRGQVFGLRPNNETGHPVVDDLTGGAHVTNDDRQAAGHRFDGGNAEALGPGREDEKISFYMESPEKR